MRKKEEILVKNYSQGKFCIAYAHTLGKWYVVEAESREQARSAAKAKEKILAGSGSKELNTLGKFAHDFCNPKVNGLSFYIKRPRAIRRVL